MIDHTQISTQIRNDLDELDIQYEYLTHNPTPTSQDSANVHGVDIGDGIKALVLETNTGKLIMCCVLGANHLNMNKLRSFLNDKVKIADREKVAATGLQIGGIPPIGKLFNMPTYFDESIESKEEIWFNCGTQTESIGMAAKDLIAYAKPHIIDIV